MLLVQGDKHVSKCKLATSCIFLRDMPKFLVRVFQRIVVFWGRIVEIYS